MAMDEPKKRGRPRKPPTPKIPKEKVPVVMPELPPAQRKDHKGIHWTQDPEILARLATVASMMVQGAKPFQIADALTVDVRTIYRDIARVYKLWRDEAMQEIDDARAKSIAQYEEIKMRAWEGYRKAQGEGGGRYSPTTARDMRDWLKLAMDAESHIAKLQGTELTRVDVTSKGERIGNTQELTDEQLLTIATGSGTGATGQAGGKE